MMDRPRDKILLGSFSLDSKDFFADKKLTLTPDTSRLLSRDTYSQASLLFGHVIGMSRQTK